MTMQDCHQNPEDSVEITPRTPAFSPPVSLAPERSGDVRPAPPLEEETLGALNEVWKDGGRFLVHGVSLSTPGQGQASSGPAGPNMAKSAELRDVSPQEFLAAARTPGSLCSVVLGPDKTSLPVTGLEDLAVLTTLYAAGAPVVAAAAHLLGSLKSLRQAGVRFTALDTKCVNDRGRFESHRVDVGAYGAWLALGETGASTRFGDLAMERAGEKAVGVGDAEDVAALAFFETGGPAEALGHPGAGLALRDLERAGATFFVSDNAYTSQGKGAYDAYLELARGKTDRVWTASGSFRIDEVPLERLDREPQLASTLLDRFHLFQRLAAVRKDGYSAGQALQALDEPVVGRSKAECEAAMLEVLGMSRGWAGREKSDFQNVVAAARADESLVDVAREYAHVAAAFGGRESKDDLADAFGMHRSLAPEPAARFLRMVERAQSHDVASKAFDLLYADGRADQFASREQSLDSLFATEQKLHANRQGRDSVTFSGAVDAYVLISRTLRNGEKVDDAVARYADLVGHTWRIEDAHEAFRVMREDLAAPGAVPVREREDVFLSLLDDRRPVGDAVSAYRALAVGDPPPAEFEARRAVLAHLMGRDADSSASGADAAKGVRSLPEAARDLEGLVTACVPYGGVQTVEGKRFLAFADVSSSFGEAHKALASLEHAPFPADAAERDAIYLAVARAAMDAKPVRSVHDLPTSTACLDDYWYVVRTAAGADGRPVAEQYARLLVAAGGDAAEARMAQAVVRNRLAGGGPVGVAPERREAWLTGLLQATGTTIGAWEALQWVESLPDAGEAEQRMRSVGSLVPMARRFSSAQPLKDAMGIYDDLARRSRSPQAQPADAAALLADVAARIPYAGNAADTLDRVCRSLLDPGADLEAVMADLRGLALLLDTSRRSFEMVNAWPDVRRVPAGLSHEERARALQVLLGTERCSMSDLAGVYRTVATDVTDGATLLANAGVMATLLQEKGSKDAVELYQAIREGLHPVAALGEVVDAARMARYAGMVASGADREDLKKLLETVCVPVAGEPLADRETVVAGLWRLGAEMRASDCSSQTLESYQTLARTLFPGERLADVAGLFEEVARAVRKQEVARDVIGRLQSERLQGSFPRVPLRELVERFVQAFAVSGDVDRSMEILHRPASSDPVVVDGEEEVTVGGIRIPKRKGVVDSHEE